MQLFISFILIISLISHQVVARFTLDTCWYRDSDCILRTASGSMCYVPDGTVEITPCTGAGHADLATVFKTHLQQDLSIAYYNGLDNVRLGGVDFNVPSDGSTVRLCLSGQAIGGSYWTLCLDAVGDNVLSGSRNFCKLRQVPAVSDGCYSAQNSTSVTTTIKFPTATPLKNSAVSERGLRDSYLFLFILIYFCQYFPT